MFYKETLKKDINYNSYKIKLLEKQFEVYGPIITDLEKQNKNIKDEIKSIKDEIEQINSKINAIIECINGDRKDINCLIQMIKKIQTNSNKRRK